MGSDGLMIWVSLSQKDADSYLGCNLSLQPTELKIYSKFSENLGTRWREEKIPVQVQRLEPWAHAGFMGEKPASLIQGSVFPQLLPTWPRLLRALPLEASP